MANTKIPPELVDDQVFGRKNVIINGSMQVAQRGTSTADLGGSGTNQFGACDRWKIVTNGISGRVTQSQETDSPDDFGFSTKLACTTADTSIGASDYFILQYDVEGQDLKRFAKGTSSAKEFTISFFVKGNASATYTLELYDTDNNRQISKTYSVTTSWTRVEITYPADTTGANNADSTSGLSIKFWLHAGTDRTSGTLNSSAWGAGSNTANRVSSSSTNFFDSTSRTFFITGVQFEVGSQATPFEHLTFGEELALCQRYFTNIAFNTSWFMDAYLAAYGYSTHNVNFPTQMRGAPTNNPAIDKSEFTRFNVTETELKVHVTGQNGFVFQMRATSTGRTYVIGNTTGSLSFDAEI